MEYDLSPKERQDYVNTRGKIIVTACPGSGKTTSIVYKLRKLHEEIESSNKHTGVLCLSFTNQAVDEIVNTYRAMHGVDIRYPHEVSTIDSFITQNIVFPYWNLCGYCKAAPMIVNEKEQLHDLLWYHYTDKTGKIQDACRIGGYGKTPRQIPPEKVNLHAGKFYNGISIMKDENKQYAKDVVRYRLAAGFLTSADAMAIALDLLSKYPIIAKSIAIRYPYIIVDEAQDTSSDQFALFMRLLDGGLKNLEFVGDTNQSIYEWRFANPDTLDALSNTAGWKHIPFVNNRRSVQRIIDLYLRLVPKNKRQQIISVSGEDRKLPIVIYRYDLNNSTEVIKDFCQTCNDYNLKEKLILTRGRNLGKLLSGAKERPDYWKSPVPKMLINAYVDFKSGYITKAVQQIAYVWSMYLFKEHEYDKKREFVKKKIENPADSTFLVNLLIEMPGLDETFQTWTSKMQIYLKSKFGLTTALDFDVYKRKKTFDIKVMAKRKLANYFGNDVARTRSVLAIQTIHSSKGMTTDAVLVFLSMDNSSKNISLNLFQESAKMTEKHRLLYVACSRARQFLALAIPIDYPEAQLNKLLKGANYEVRIPGVIKGLF